MLCDWFVPDTSVRSQHVQNCARWRLRASHAIALARQLAWVCTEAETTRLSSDWQCIISDAVQTPVR